MQTPYELLEVDETATDEAIKKAYLRKVREFPPERNAEAFQRIRTAFEAIETDKRRREYRLFHCEPLDPADLLRLIPPPKGSLERPAAAALIGALLEGLPESLIDPHAKP